MQESRLPLLLKQQLSMCNHSNIAVCTNFNCLTCAFICNDEKCINSYIFHSSCTKVLPQHFIKIIQSQRTVLTMQAKQYFQKVEQIYQTLIETISVQKNNFTQSVEMFGLKPYSLKMMQKLKNGQGEEINGNQIITVYTEIADSWGNISIPQTENIKQFWSHSKTWFEKMLKQLDKLRFAPQTIFPSKIIQPYQINQLISFFNKPIKEVKLLFRASANNFSSSKFVEQCKDIQDTLILFKTADSIFGGYTPVKWQSSNFAREKSDYTGKSFLFSLDRLEKYPIKDKQKAIRCWNQSGPNFGEGDLFIVDQCNRNSSVTQFPRSYMSRTQNEQNMFQIFSGRKNEARFKVIEYEVYQIIWKQYVIQQEILKLGENFFTP